MAGINPYRVQQRIVDYAGTVLKEPIFEGGVPSPETIVRDGNGNIRPYVVMRFSDVSRDYRGNSMAGPRLDSYYGFCDFVCVAADDRTARAVSGNVMDKMTGFTPDEGGPFTKVGGGGEFTILDGRDKPAAYVSITGYRYALNYDLQT
jgi:hypothetical protein